MTKKELLNILREQLYITINQKSPGFYEKGQCFEVKLMLKNTNEEAYEEDEVISKDSFTVDATTD